jgi:hypothetical protein
MPRTSNLPADPMLLEALLEGLELQKSRIEEQIQQVRSSLSRGSKSRQAAPSGNGHAQPKRHLSPEARKRIAAAQKKRWAEFRKSGGSKQ